MLTEAEFEAQKARLLSA
ncbi:hypothetical protein ACRAWC_03265 [Leifsonia sp. L25]